MLAMAIGLGLTTNTSEEGREPGHSGRGGTLASQPCDTEAIRGVFAAHAGFVGIRS